MNKEFSNEKIKVIYNGLDLERFKPKEVNRAAICEEFGLPKDENIKYITLVANLRHDVKKSTDVFEDGKKKF